MRGNLYVLLDANIIIQAHECGVWQQLIRQVTLVVPSIVRQEAQRFTAADIDLQRRINIEPEIVSGLVREVTASAEQLVDLYQRFDSVFVQRMDKGESEALALLLAGALPDHRFCTGDGPAIRALSLLDMPETGISLDMLLRQVGLSRRLPRQFTDSFFQEQLNQGAEERVRGEGLRKSSPPNPPRGAKRKKRK